MSASAAPRQDDGLFEIRQSTVVMTPSDLEGLDVTDAMITRAAAGMNLA
jgi:hypothetical protein